MVRRLALVQRWDGGDTGAGFRIGYRPAQAVAQAAAEVLGLKVVALHSLGPGEPAVIVDYEYAWHGTSFVAFLQA